MTVERRYTEQMPFVGTASQRAAIEREERRMRSSMAEVIRSAVDHYFGFVDGEPPPDWKDPRNVAPLRMRPKRARSRTRRAGA
jgi:hypothetical protein